MAAKLTPETELKVVSMIAAGWSNASIARQLDISVSTVQRVKIRTKTKSGEAKDLAIKEAKASLSEALSSEYAKGKAAMLIRDDFAMGEELRRKSAMMLESIPDRPVSAKEAVVYARALTSVATSLKLSSDTLRQTLKLSSPNLDDLEELPVLEVREMYADEIAEIRESQKQMAKEQGWGQ